MEASVQLCAGKAMKMLGDESKADEVTLGALVATMLIKKGQFAFLFSNLLFANKMLGRIKLAWLMISFCVSIGRLRKQTGRLTLTVGRTLENWPLASPAMMLQANAGLSLFFC